MPRLTRAGLLRGGAASALGLSFPAAASAAAPTDDDLSLLRLAASAELVSTAYYERAARWRSFSPAVGRLLLRAREIDLRHYRLLAAQIGAEPPRASDLDISFPRAAFRRTTGVLGLGQIVEQTLRGVYVHAASAHTTAELREQAASLAASEAAHLTVLERLNGGSGLGAVLPRALDPEQASAALGPYWGSS
jgi:Ferritin-like domain